MRRTSVVASSRFMLLALAAGGCGTSASIETREGRRVEARIVGGSPGSIYVAGDDHTKFTMRREDIASVDFPGNLLLLGGVALTGYGGYRLWTGDTSCAAFGQLGTCLSNVGPVVVGLLAFGWGLYSYYRSTHAFEDRSRPEPDPVMAPRPPRPAVQLPGWRKPDPFADPKR